MTFAELLGDWKDGPFARLVCNLKKEGEKLSRVEGSLIKEASVVSRVYSQSMF